MTCEKDRLPCRQWRASCRKNRFFRQFLHSQCYFVHGLLCYHLFLPVERVTSVLPFFQLLLSFNVRSSFGEELKPLRESMLRDT